MKTTPNHLRLATDGTDPAINFPPVNYPPKLEGELKGENSTEQNYTWKTCSPQARVVLEAMRRATPKGAATPWRSSPSVTPIQRLLNEGIPMEDLLELVRGGAALVAAGREQPRWWYPSNLFGASTLERWMADVAEHEAATARAEDRTAELAAIDERASHEREQAAKGPGPKVRDLELHKLAEACLAQVREKTAAAERENEETHAGVVLL